MFLFSKHLDTMSIRQIVSGQTDLWNKDDGEFYMSIQDFVRIFNILSICNVSHLKPGMAWHEEKIYGSWIKHVSAGGCSSWKSFAKNPQFKAKICLTGNTIRRIDIESRCFENKNNNCCETKFVKMPFVYYYLQIYKIPIWLLCSLDILAAGWPDYGFVHL